MCIMYGCVWFKLNADLIAQVTLTAGYFAVLQMVEDINYKQHCGTVTRTT